MAKTNRRNVGIILLGVIILTLSFFNIFQSLLDIYDFNKKPLFALDNTKNINNEQHNEDQQQANLGGSDGDDGNPANSNNKLSSVSEITLFITYAFLFGFQPILIKLFVPTTVKRNVVIFCQEFVKLIMSILMLISTCSMHPRGSSCIDTIINNWTISGALVAAGIPSIIFVVQGNCNIFANQQLKPVAFVVLNQTKIVWTAICCYFLLGQRQSKIQMIALLLVILATLWLQKVLPICCSRSFIRQYIQRKEEEDDDKGRETPLKVPMLHKSLISTASSDSVREEKAIDDRNDLEKDEHKDNDKADQVVAEQHRVEMLGVLLALFASFLSGLSGSITQLTLQQNNRNPLLFNIELSIISMAIIVLRITSDKLISSLRWSRSSSTNEEIEIITNNNNNNNKSDERKTDDCGSNDEQQHHRGEAVESTAAAEGGTQQLQLFVGFTWHVWIPIVSQAFGGIMIGLVTKYLGAVMKGFSCVFGIAISSILQQILFKDIGGLSFEELIGACLCAASLWLHVTY